MKTNHFYPLIFILLQGFFPSFVNASETTPETWLVDTALFQIHGDSLQLRAPSESGEAYIFRPSQSFENAAWEININMDFNPSSSNYLKIYLAVDGKKNFNNGFFLIAGTTKDNVSLWTRKNGTDEKLIEGSEERLDASPAVAKIKVTRTNGGLWTLSTKTPDSPWTEEGQIDYTPGYPTEWFGFSCHYTKTRSDKFFLGPFSIEGEAYTDTVAPKVSNTEVLNRHTLQMQFSEPIDTTSRPIISLADSPLAISDINFSENSSMASLALKSPLTDIQDEPLSISGWQDASGNPMADTTLLISYFPPSVAECYAENHKNINICFNTEIPEELVTTEVFQFANTEISVDTFIETGDACYSLALNKRLPDAETVDLYLHQLILTNEDTIPEGPYEIYYHEPARNDLVISEIMHDPNPPALLPEVEYIELFNRSSLPVNLKNMVLQVNDNQIVLPAHLIFPDEYVVLFREESADFPNSLPLEKWHALTNSGGTIVLRNVSGRVISAFKYPHEIAGDSFKQARGWSFEKVDADNLSQDIQNWAYCQNDSGGSPGLPNSVEGPLPDVNGPTIKDAWFEEDSVLVLDFGEPLNPKAFTKKHFSVENPELIIDSIAREPVFNNQAFLHFNQALTPHKEEVLTLSADISDLAENPITGETSLPFGLPGAIDSLDILINELLFDPPENGSDYVEIFNRSDHIASLDSLCLARGDENGVPEELNPLSDRTRWILPGERLCFAKKTQWMHDHYNDINHKDLRKFEDLPNYVNAGGTVFLTRLNGTAIDRMDYSPAWHYELLSDTKAVALERTSHDGETNNPMTWHSASADVNYGTPTLTNSQFITETKTPDNKLFSTSPEIFIPNQNGTDDLLIITYELNNPGHKGTFIIYDVDGRQVKQLVNNRTLSTSGKITWDGTTDAHQKASPGIYIVWGRIFDLQGNVREYKESCVLGIPKH